ncbi:prosaposin [Aplysia californica]|uniref:Prosaposin n=1 Tax=Aplysia californica TaxID=6500 RepID=A0ABM1A4F3_APLCA|nr:prosaposin [Aplysia californica]
MFCEFLKFCESDADKTKAMHLHGMKFLLRQYLDGPSDASCKTCKAIMGQVKNLLAQKNFQESTQEVVASEVCERGPKLTQEKCKQLITKYGHLMFEIVIAELDEEFICETVQMCPETGKGRKPSPFVTKAEEVLESLRTQWNDVKFQIPKKKANLRNLECSSCEFFVSEFIRMLHDPQTQNKVLSTVERVCNFVPDPLGTQCRNFIHRNGRIFMKMITQLVTPKLVCEAIGLCDISKQAEAVHQLEAIINEAKLKAFPLMSVQKTGAVSVSQAETPWCRVCKDLMSIPASAVGSQELQQSSIFFLHQICAIFPDTVTTRCGRISTIVVDAVLGGATIVLQPASICGLIGVCDADLVPVHYNVTYPDPPKRNTVLRFSPEN